MKLRLCILYTLVVLCITGCTDSAKEISTALSENLPVIIRDVDGESVYVYLNECSVDKPLSNRVDVLAKELSPEMYNLVKELKNNNLVYDNLVYLRDEDEEFIHLFDIVYVYEELKDKVSVGKIKFSNNDELAVHLGYDNAQELEEVIESKRTLNFIEDYSYEMERVFLDKQNRFKSLMYDKDGNVCTNDESAVITFKADGKRCTVKTDRSMLPNYVTIEHNDKMYLLFIQGVTSVTSINNYYLCDIYKWKVLIDEKTLLDHDVNGIEYFRVMQGIKPIQGFVVSEDYIMQDYSKNTKQVADAYNILTIKDDWGVFEEFTASENVREVIFGRYISR